MEETVLIAENICKSFPGVNALDNVNIELFKGEVLCIAGENGAGKSTFVKILSGVLQPDKGKIILNGNKIEIKNPLIALNNGLSVVYQEHKLINNLTIAENIFFGRFPHKAMGFIDFDKLNQNTLQLIRELDIELSPKMLAGDLTTAQSHLVEIMKALSIGANILILDEPSASINESELNKIFDIIKKLKKEGKSFIYISHRLEELFQIGDRVAVFKDGRVVGVEHVSKLTSDRIIRMMVGRDIISNFDPQSRKFDKEALKVHELTNDRVKNCSFYIREGEVVGFAGLVGSGRSELAESIFGYRKISSGKIFIDGNEVNIKKPYNAIFCGMGFVTEDRLNTGLILSLSVGINITFIILSKLTKLGFIRSKRENQIINNSIQNLRIKVQSYKQEVQYLSGGNQQKVVLAKWLLTKSKILIFDEPTKGIDIGAKEEFYKIIDNLARQGMAIMMISSDIREIISLSNRVYVMNDGRIVKELNGDFITEENIVKYAIKEGA